MELSANTRAALLLTAPLLSDGPSSGGDDLMSPGEYRNLTQFLRQQNRRPADLLEPAGKDLIAECRPRFGGERVDRLLSRGFLLSQVVEHWQSRAIWVVSQEDAGYPRRFHERLGPASPPILFGCGDFGILDSGGLAVVGSRRADDSLTQYAQTIGNLVASAGRTLISGGARGIDQSAMLGALECGGRSVAVLADSLERAALNREHRRLLIEKQLVLVSPYDPLAGFHVGHAMQRNKLIYALADAALVVDSDRGRGGTWAGAIEQLTRLNLVPVYVRSTGEATEGLEALRRRGALLWPNPKTREEVVAAINGVGLTGTQAPAQPDLFPLESAPRGRPSAVSEKRPKRLPRPRAGSGSLSDTL